MAKINKSPIITLRFILHFNDSHCSSQKVQVILPSVFNSS